jgi:hypothetical protein
MKGPAVGDCLKHYANKGIRAVHPDADRLPLMSGEEYRDLLSDVREHGFTHSGRCSK